MWDCLYDNYTLSVLCSSWNSLWSSVADFIPRLFAALIVFLIGWVVAVAVGKLVWHLVKFIQLDRGLESIGFKRVWERSGHKLDSGLFFYELVKWFLIVLALLVATDILGLTAVTAFLRDVVWYVPNVFIAALVLVIGVLVAKFVEHAVRSSVRAAELHSANFLAMLGRWAVLVFSFLIALDQLGIGEEIIRIAVWSIFGALALGFGLAFGLGGRDHADEWLSSWRKRIQD